MLQHELRTPVRLNAHAWGLALGIVFGVGLLVATNILVLKGGRVVGPHLALLGAYLPGYRVTFAGSVVGLIWGAVIGYAAGWVLGSVYNALLRRG
jgi:hypothetical protein